MNDPRPPRRYDDDEVARILKRATEIRSEGKAVVRREEGLTLQQLEEIAAEAGIDVGHLRRAAMELDHGPDPRGESFVDQIVGAPMHHVMEETLEGELDEDGFEVMAELIQRVMREHGHPSLMARTLSWRNEVAKSGGRSTTVSITSRGGRTTVRVEENLQQPAGGFQGGITAGGGVGLGVGLGVPLAQAVGSVFLGVAFPLGILGVAYVVARGSFRAYVSRRRRIMRDALARLVQAVSREVNSVKPDTTSLPGDGGAPRLRPATEPPPRPDLGDSHGSGSTGSLL